MGFETTKAGLYGNHNQRHWMLNPGLGMGAKIKHPLLKDLLDEYNERSFIYADDSLNLETICETTSRFFYLKGMKSDNIHQNICDFHLFPKDNGL